MKILVCIKQVPDMESKFKVNAAGNWYEETDLAWRMNEYDEYAVEQAVQLKQQVGDADLTVLKDPYAIASLISEYAKDKDFDLIFTGMQSQDRGSCQVGVLVAEMLGIPSLTTLVEFSYADGTINAKRELEGGIKAKVSCATPALVTCQLGLNTPRYPTLPNIMKAKKKELISIPVADLNPADSLLEVLQVAPPEKKGGGLILEGDPADLADQLIQILKEKTTALA